MKVKKKRVVRIIVLIICILLIVFFLSSFVKANSVEENNKKISVKYNSKILDAFENKSLFENLINQPDFIGLEIIGDEVWGRIIINIKDNSGIEYSGTKEERLEQSKQKDKWFAPVTQKVLDDITKTEIKDINKGVNGFSALVTKKGFEELINDGRIDKVIWSQYGPKPFLGESIPIMNADDAWSSGYTGEGINVCIIDSGVNSSYPGLMNKVLGEKCYCSDNCCSNGLASDDDATDYNGHGTIMAQTLASNHSNYTGISYGVGIYAVRIADDSGEFSQDWQDTINAIDWCRNQGADIISMSFGYGHYSSQNCIDDADTSINNAHNVGIVLTSASGNEGHTNGVSYPACQENVISVGATYDGYFGDWKHCWGWPCWEWLGNACTDENIQPDDLVCLSNRGENLDLLASGCIIDTPTSGEAVYSDCGTSYTSPLVAGAAALLLEKVSYLEPEAVKLVFQETGVSVGSWKRIDVGAALDAFCVCDSWTYDACDTGGCGPMARLRTRDCSPSACDTESECFYDEGCAEPGGETSECTEPGYEYCWEYASGNCDVSIAVNMYENINDIRWGAVNDAWDPYVISNYVFGWKGVDIEHMYYGDGVNETCSYGGCDNSSEVDEPDTLVTTTSPGVADREMILGYDDTVEYACWLWNPVDPNFIPNYGSANPIYVLNCFNESDCSANQYCDKSSSWSNWDCVSKKSNGQACTYDTQCSSGYCDNDGVGLSDDGWCFAPYNIYFDGQETSYCELSAGYGIDDCDERQIGTDLNKCVGVAFYEDECGSTCGYQDITSVFECTETGCSCSQPLCDGLTSISNITNCSSGETYFADKCGSAASGEDRGDNICRSSTFAGECTADSECNGIEAGTGNCTIACNYLPANDANRFYINNSLGYAIAWLGDEGNIVLSGKCFSGGSCDNPGSGGSFIFRDSADNNVAFINSTGDLCIETGDCSDQSASCNPSNDAFIVRNMSDYNMSYIDLTNGDLCLTGKLYEDTNP